LERLIMDAATIIHTWSNGARKLELDGFQFTVSHTGRISWATPDGWARIAVDRETFPILETYTVWQPYGPTYNDEEFTYAGAVSLINREA
jgi:hypothetical protein